MDFTRFCNSFKWWFSTPSNYNYDINFKPIYKTLKSNFNSNYDIFISNVKIWEQNRIPDKKRVEEITKGYIEGNIVPCVFHVSEIKIKNNTEYKLWDGQHRYKALRDLYLKLPDLKFSKS